VAHQKASQVADAATLSDLLDGGAEQHHGEHDKVRLRNVYSVRSIIGAPHRESSSSVLLVVVVVLVVVIESANKDDYDNDNDNDNEKWTRGIRSAAPAP
jgi:hypothetical protein